MPLKTKFSNFNRILVAIFTDPGQARHNKCKTTSKFVKCEMLGHFALVPLEIRKEYQKVQSVRPKFALGPFWEDYRSL